MFIDLLNFLPSLHLEENEPAPCPGTLFERPQSIPKKGIILTVEYLLGNR